MPEPAYSPLQEQLPDSGRHSAPPHLAHGAGVLRTHDGTFLPLSRTPEATLLAPSSRSSTSSSRPQSPATPLLPPHPTRDSSDASDTSSHRLLPSTPSLTSKSTLPLPPPLHSTPHSALFQSSPTAHRALLHRLTLRLVPLLFGCYLASFVDRIDLSSAADATSWPTSA